jgi:hypothetical protein
VVTLAALVPGVPERRRLPRRLLHRVGGPPHAGLAETNVGGVAEPDAAGAARVAGDWRQPRLRQQHLRRREPGAVLTISASSTAVNTGPTPGKLAKIGLSGCSATAAAIASSYSPSWAFSSCSSRAKVCAENAFPATVTAEPMSSYARIRCART